MIIQNQFGIDYFQTEITVSEVWLQRSMFCIVRESRNCIEKKHIKCNLSSKTILNLYVIMFVFSNNTIISSYNFCDAVYCWPHERHIWCTGSSDVDNPNIRIMIFGEYGTRTFHFWSLSGNNFLRFEIDIFFRSSCKYSSLSGVSS